MATNATINGIEITVLSGTFGDIHQGVTVNAGGTEVYIGNFHGNVLCDMRAKVTHLGTYKLKPAHSVIGKCPTVVTVSVKNAAARVRRFSPGRSYEGGFIEALANYKSAKVKAAIEYARMVMGGLHDGRMIPHMPN